MSKKTEADEIEELIAEFRLHTGDWAVTLSEHCWQRMGLAEKALMDRIRSIISERDALQAAMQSHRKELR